MENKEAWKLKLAILDKRINAFLQGYRQNVALLGEGEEEISYLLENYFSANKFSEITRIHATTSYVDAKGFFKSVASAVLAEVIPANGTLNTALQMTPPELKSTVTFVKNVISGNAVDMTSVLNLLNIYMRESGKKCLFIVEEFLGLKKIFPACFDEFSKFIIVQRNCMLVITASRLEEAERTLAGELNLLFGDFEKIHTEKCAFFDCYTYLSQRMGSRQLSPFLLSFFINILGTNAYYYDFISYLLGQDRASDNDDDLIAGVLQQALYDKYSQLFQKFIKQIDLINALSRDSRSLIKVLLALSEGYLRKKDLAALNNCPQKELAAKCAKLAELNLIASYGDIYKIKDPLFSFWLAHVFKLYFWPPLLDAEKRRALWDKHIREETALYRDNFLKDKVKKVLELIAAFKDDSVKMGKSRYYLPSIERTKILSYPERRTHLFVGEGSEIIFVGIKDAVVEDNDIIEFMAQGSGIKGKGVQRIFISLNRFTPAAKLIAKNNKLITWDADEINNLLRVYNHPLMVIGTAQNNENPGTV